jgi:hypothetical protein
VTEDPAPVPDEEEPEAEIEWHPVARWPQAARVIMTDIDQIRAVIEQMQGSADDSACQVFTDFLDHVLLARRRELAITILGEHGIEIPEPGALQTPQERMSAGLKHMADEVRKRRDIVPEKQPPTERSRRHLPEMKT